MTTRLNEDDPFAYPNNEDATRSVKTLLVVTTLLIFACGIGIVMLIVKYGEVIDNLFK